MSRPIHGRNSKLISLTGFALMLAPMVALLSACGSQMTPRTASLYSGGGPTSVAPIINVAGDGMTECSTFDTTTTRLTGKVTSYYYNDVLQEDKVRLRFSAVPDLFSTKSGVYIQMFRWNFDSTGTAFLDSVNPVQFNVELGRGSVSPIASDLTSLNFTDVARLRTANSIAGTTATDFFANTTLVLRAVDYNWSAIKIVVYDGTTVIGQTDSLLPAFQANPNRYAAAHSAILSQLHPFWAQRSQSYSESEWATRARSLCF